MCCSRRRSSAPGSAALLAVAEAGETPALPWVARHASGAPKSRSAGRAEQLSCLSRQGRCAQIAAKGSRYHRANLGASTITTQSSMATPAPSSRRHCPGTPPRRGCLGHRPVVPLVLVPLAAPARTLPAGAGPPGGGRGAPPLVPGLPQPIAAGLICVANCSIRSRLSFKLSLRKSKISSLTPSPP